MWLGDSLGEMPLYYAASDVALLGGSFAPLGGQNLIEAAACACPVVMGPHTFNFEQAADNAVAERAALRVADIDEGVARAIELTRDALHAQWSERAAAFAQMHKGAARRMAERIVQLAGARIGARLPTPPASNSQADASRSALQQLERFQRRRAGQHRVVDRAARDAQVVVQHALEDGAQVGRDAQVAAFETVLRCQARPVGDHAAAAHRAAQHEGRAAGAVVGALGCR